MCEIDCRACRGRIAIFAKIPSDDVLQEEQVRSIFAAFYPFGAASPRLNDGVIAPFWLSASTIDFADVGFAGVNVTVVNVVVDD